MKLIKIFLKINRNMIFYQKMKQIIILKKIKNFQMKKMKKFKKLIIQKNYNY